MLYSRDHGGIYPERLSQLVPIYSADTRAFYFTCRYGATFKPSAPADDDPKLIDVFSPYALLPLGDGRAIVFERLPMWSDATVGFQILGPDVPPADHVQRQRLPREEFARRYLEGFK